MAEVRVEDIKPNSHAYKEQEKKKERSEVKQVVKKSAIVPQKESFGKKFAKSFLADEVNDVKEYIIMDCIVPGIKNAILNMISMSFFGESYDGGRRRGRDDRYDYSSYYGRSSYSGRDRDRREKRREESRERDRSVDCRNIILYDRRDAEDLVDAMRDRIRDTGGVSVAELLTMIDEPSKYTDNDYGWDRADDIGIKRVSRGFLIDVPEPRYIG